MARPLSTRAINEINSVANGAVFLYLLTFIDNSPKGNPAINVVNNNVDITSNGTLYSAYAFNITLSPDDGETLPTIQLTLDNVDRLLVESIRTFNAPPTVNIQIIIADTPDEVEIAIPDMTLRNVNFNAVQITGTLVIEDILNQKFPADRVTKKQYAGIF